MSKKSNINEFIEKSNKTHDNFFNYSKFVYIDNNTKGVVICPTHGEFEIIPRHHTSGTGCAECSGNKKSSTEKFVFKANKIHNNFFNYFKSVYINAKTIITITCPIHGDFITTPNWHLSGRGCPKCVGRNKTTEDFILESNTIHNNFFKYTKTVYDGAQTDVIITCPIHGDFLQTPDNHLHKKGCIKCAYEKTISKPEKEFLDYINITPRFKKIGKYHVDGYDPETNTIIEFLGDYWHGNPVRFNPYDINYHNKTTFLNLYLNTFDRFYNLYDMGYNIKYIWEYDWLRFKNGLDEEPKIYEYGFY